MYHISDFCKSDLIKLEVEKIDKTKLFEDIADTLNHSKNIHSKQKILNSLHERETLGSTGIGYGIAIPHVRLDSIDRMTISIITCPDGIEYESIDDIPVKIVFAIAANTSEKKLYTILVAKISRLLKDKTRRNRIIQSKNPEEIMEVIKEFDYS